MDAGTPEERTAASERDAAALASAAGDDAATASAQTDAGRGAEPLERDGDPLPGAPGTWTYSEFPDALCRDGSPTGVSVNLGSASKLMIFLEGGGVCDGVETCALSPASLRDPVAIGQSLLAQSEGGVFNRDHPENPVGDWHVAYVHYCSGDRYGGANLDADVPGVGPQRLAGYLNMKRLLRRIVPTFHDVTEVLLTGVSAGGAGAQLVSVLVQRAFPQLKIKVINDSGPPPLDARVIPACLQERWRTLGRFEQTFLAECAAACPNPNDYMQDFGLYLAQTFGDRPSGLIETMEDWVERALFGVGGAGCAGAIDWLEPGVSPEAYRTALLSFRERVRPFANYGTFYIDGDWATRSAHTWLMSDDLYTVRAGDVRLVDWVRKIVDGQSPGHAGP